MSNRKLAAGVAFVALAIATLFYFLPRESNSLDSSHPLLAKRLALNNPDDTLINFAPLRNDVKSYLDKLNVKSSFYFEYLFTGTSIRYGDNQELVAASLLKIPVVMGLYRAKEAGIISLDKEMTLTSSEIDNEYGDLWKKGAGSKISLGEAAKLAIVNSDNTAALAIFDNIKNLQSPVNLDAMKELDVDVTAGPDKTVEISARSYASFLKCLYFACFLNKDDSEIVLDQMVQSTLDNGLMDGVPGDVKVANKIGTFSDINASDCGIVYAPKRTYLICAMLQMPDAEAKPHIKNLSQMVYDYVTKVQDPAP